MPSSLEQLKAAGTVSLPHPAIYPATAGLHAAPAITQHISRRICNELR